MVLGDASAATQTHRAHALRLGRLAERGVGLLPSLPAALRRRLPGEGGAGRNDTGSGSLLPAEQPL